MYRVHMQIGFRQSTFDLDLMQSNFTEKSRRKTSQQSTACINHLSGSGDIRGAYVDPNLSMLFHTPQLSNLKSPGH